jgi:hypothetical protein
VRAGLRSFLPPAQEFDGVPFLIIVNELGIVLTQPDPVVRGRAFLGRQKGIEARSAMCGGGDVRGYTNVGGL